MNDKNVRGFTAWVEPASKGPVSNSLAIDPTWFKVSDRGGSDRADFRVTGSESALWEVLGWLGRKIHVFDAYGSDVWRGKIHEVDLNIAGMKIALSYQNLYNRVRVLYTFRGPDGTPRSGVTEWADDTVSQSVHGIREMIHTMNETFDTRAAAKRDRILDEFATPKGEPNVGTDENGATISAQGVYAFLEWTYFERLEGRISHPYNPDTEIMVGWQLAGAYGINFYRGLMNDNLSRFGNVMRGNRITIGGSGLNSGHWTVTKEAEFDELITLTTDRIYIEPKDDIFRDDGNFDMFYENHMIVMSGSDHEDRTHAIETVGYDNGTPTMKISETFNGQFTEPVQDYGDSTVTITMGNNLELDDGSVLNEKSELLALDLTSWGYGCAQRFLCTEDMEAQLLALSVRRIGNPVDSFVVSIYSDSAGEIGSNLGTKSVAGSSLYTELQQVWFEFTTPINLANGTYYWIIVTRDGGQSYEDFYTLGFTTNLLENGSTKLNNSSEWFDVYDISLSFILWSTEDTGEQIKRIMSECIQFAESVIYEDGETGIRTNPWQDGRSRALTLVNEMLDQGVDGGNRLIVRDDPNFNLIIKQEADKDVNNAKLVYADGTIKTANAGPLPLGLLPVGEWVVLADLPGDFSEVLGELSPVYIQAAEVDLLNNDPPRLHPRNTSAQNRIKLL